MANAYVRAPRFGTSTVVLPMLILYYMESRPRPCADVNFDSKRFLEMWLDSNHPTVDTVSVSGDTYMSRVGGWFQRLCHWENRGPRDHPAVGEYDMPYVRSFEDVDYHRRGM